MSARTRDIGVRIALAAGSRDILVLVVRQGVVLAASGLVFGIALAYAAGRSMQAILAGVSPRTRPPSVPRRRSSPPSHCRERSSRRCAPPASIR